MDGINVNVKKVDTEALIKGLGENLRPIKTVALWRYFVTALVIAVAYVALVLKVAFVPRPDFPSYIRTSPLGLILALLGIAGTLGIIFALRATLGARPAANKKPVARLVLALAVCYLVAMLGYAIFYSSQLLFHREDIVCAVLIYVLALPIWIFAIVAGPYVGRNGRGYEWGTGCLAFASGATIINVHCSFEGPGHYFWGHGVEALILAGGVFFILALLTRRAVAYLTLGRAECIRKSILK